jgi:hypothetical protein
VNEHLHEVTVSRDVVEKFYPLLADLILEVRGVRIPPRAARLTARSFQAQLRDSDDEAEEVWCSWLLASQLFCTYSSS